METLTLHPHRGEPTQVSATLRRTPPVRRFLRSASLVTAGILLGTAAIVLPPHGLWTLAFWVVSCALGWLFWSRTVVIGRLEGVCSSCHAPLRLDAVGPWSPDLWVRCPACQAPYRVEEPPP